MSDHDHKTAQELLEANRVLDEHVAATAEDLVSMRRLIDDHDSIIHRQNRQAHQQRILSIVLAVIAVVAVVLGVAGLRVALDVEHNSREINRTQEAIAVYCAQTNVYNDEAHSKFLDLFPNPQDPARVEAIADVAFPHRNCTVRPGGVITTDGTAPGLSTQATSTTVTP